MAHTLEKVISAGYHDPGVIPTKIYVDKGKGSIVALESVDVIAERYEKALGGGAQSPLVQFTDYRGNPSAIRIDLIKGYTSLCSEAEHVAALMAAGHIKPLKVKAQQPELGDGAESEIIGLLTQLVETVGAKH